MSARPPTWKAAVETLASMAVALAVVAAAGYFVREPVRELARAFVARAGYAGMCAGTFASDYVLFPVPPQFYMLTSIAAGTPALPSLVAISSGSVLAAALAYPTSRHVAKIGFVGRRLEVLRPRVEPIFTRYAPYAIAVGAISPLPFPWLCYFAGIYRMPLRYYAVFVALRPPRLALFYALIKLGWGVG